MNRTVTNAELIKFLLKIAQNERVTFADRMDAIDHADAIFLRNKQPWSYYGLEIDTTSSIANRIAGQLAEAIRGGYSNADGNGTYHDFIVATTPPPPEPPKRRFDIRAWLKQ